jgi:hypothetical protein
VHNSPALRRVVAGIAIAAIVACASTALAQRRRGFGYGYAPLRMATPESFDGGFNFCRIMFGQSPDGDGANWSVDYPRADINLSIRLSELTRTRISRDSSGEPNHVLLRLTDDLMFQCPFIMMTEVGALYMDDQEAAHLRDYLLRGGFLWADDFWGERAWSVWQSQISKALPEFPIIELPLEHALFHMLYQVPKVPQIPSINSWFGRGGSTSERGAETAVPHARGIVDQRGNLLGLITFNTDFGDAFEREGENKAYFDEFAGVGYAFGINALLYAMSH